MTGSLEIRDVVLAQLANWRSASTQPLVVGLCGAQGSGKSTVAAQIEAALTKSGTRTISLSLDDFYYGSAKRQALSHEVHPLLRTRGVPGTHDTHLAMRTVSGLREGQAISIPRFDKALDDRLPDAPGRPQEGQIEVIIFEGWCVGARAQSESDLSVAVNALEAEYDADGRWRRYVNDRLAQEYRILFGMLDRLILLAAPSFAVVENWRLEQEESLRASLFATGRDTSSLMDRAAVRQFTQYYERLTKHILKTMPTYTDLTLNLDERRRPVRAVAR